LVVVTNTVTGCDVQGLLPILLDVTRSTPNIIDVATTHPVNCNPTGTAVVTKITLGSTSNSILQPPAIPPDNEVTGAALLNFNYEWYIGSTDAANQLPLNGPPYTVTPSISTLSPGSYFVLVRDPSTDCRSTAREVVINDNNIVYPVVEISQTGLQVGCLPVGTGELTATADVGLPVNSVNSPANYEFFWYKGLTADGTALNTTSSPVLGALDNGEFSVSVHDLTTNCFSEAFYIIIDQSDQFRPVLSLSSEGRMNCLNPDGILLAREVGYDPTSGYPFNPPSYTVQWYVGAGADTSLTGNIMTNVPGFIRNWQDTTMDVGVYTVKITDNNTSCSAILEHEVLDQRTPPVVVIVEDNPLINCDVNNANGQLSATADNGQIGGYTFAWYNATDVAGTVLAQSNILIGETIGDYVVRVTNDFTGCFTDETGEITDGRLYPPVPEVLVVQDRAHCVNPDGWLSASVGGVTFNYSFDWYIGTADGSADFNGTDYKDLDIGSYQVTAMDEVTGCISDPATALIKDVRVYPELFFTTTPSYCEELPDVNFTGNGTVDLEFRPSDVIADDIQWTSVETGDFAGLGSYLRGVMPGFYEAEFVTSMGCVATGTAEVKTEIKEYNLVTVNGDGKNDAFKIDCISKFKNNNVKIFNRSGVMVYEADGYDNVETVFTGIGTKGVYAAGNVLPVGTYFFIIDKRDGSKPKTGYLELVK